jgi:hypothetical protein
VPVGTISNGQYSNEALGLRLPIPKDWTAELASGEGSLVDPAHPDSPLNQCSHVLISREKMSSKGTGFRSSDVLFVINPACFDEVAFPSSYTDRDSIAAFTNYLVKIFHGTLYIPPSGVDYAEEHTSQHLFIRMTGAGFRSANGEKGGKQIHVNTGITVTASGGYWIAWAQLLDDEAVRQMKKVNIQLRED